MVFSYLFTLCGFHLGWYGVVLRVDKGILAPLVGMQRLCHIPYGAEETALCSEYKSKFLQAGYSQHPVVLLALKTGLLSKHSLCEPEVTIV